MSPRLAFALQTAYSAGRMTLAHFDVGVGYEFKDDASPVTIADRQAERAIRDAIETSFPGEAILGEEEGGPGADDQWVIDPIDGTKSFVCGVPLYATLLSFEQAGLTKVGVAYFPALDLMVYAEKGLGAFANGRPLRVSNVNDLGRCTFSCGGHKSMQAYGRASGFMAMSSRALATRTWSDAYGHCLVAMGKIEAMVDPIVSAWDLSSVRLIVEEAGGSCTDFEGRPNPTSEAVSSNGILHETVLGFFRP